MGVIDIDFSKARAQASKLDELAGDLEKLIENDYNMTMEQIRSNWTGESANTYLAKGGTLEGEMKQTVSDIKGVANSIRETVDKLEEAQRRAQEVISGKNT